MKTPRIVKFIVVGAAGLALQFTALWVLFETVGLGAAAASVIATELAILQNFVWHARWTWSERTAGWRCVATRLMRFHGSNGIVSLAGSALLMPALVEVGHMNVLVANLLVVIACSAANFLFADRVVFARLAVFVTIASTIGLAPLRAADVQAPTASAFDRYVRMVEQRLDRELSGAEPFLLADRLAEPRRLEVFRMLTAGGIVIDRLPTCGVEASTAFVGGLCHHWAGTVFVPGATLEAVRALMQSYDEYQDIYWPAVRRSTLVAREGDHFRVSLQLFIRKIIGVTLNTESDVQYRRVSATRLQVRSSSTRIEEEGGGNQGFLWRFNNYCAVEERKGGTYVQCESLSLSRSIPGGLGWLVGPFVTSIPRESLEFTLRALRDCLLTARTRPSS